MLENVTPLILTYNEARNIGRVLEKLYWAKDIVVVDSFSTDETVAIVSRFKKVHLFQRTFDSHSNQWNFALNETGITSDWILALDADYILTDELIEEIKTLKPDQSTSGYTACFTYYSLGRPLRCSLYPPATILYRKSAARYIQDGHTQKLAAQGVVKSLTAKVLHEDRKLFRIWLAAQRRYAKLEAIKLRTHAYATLSWPDKVRRLIFLAPFSVFIYCFVAKGLVWDGLPGFWYSFQRMTAEFLLSFYLIKLNIIRCKV